MKKIPLLAALILLTLGGIVAQQQTFVLYDASCMKRVKYEQAIAQQPRMDYHAYQIPLANGNKLILETGVEGNVRQNYLPPNYLSCNDPRLNADFADNINGNRTKVFMLIPDGNDYLIQPVTMGAVLAKQGNLLTYVSPLASFQFDTRNVIIGENLAFNNANARVFFEGRDGNICGGTYLIRQLMPRNAYPVIDYKINPEIGVVERRLGSDGSTTVGGVVVARTINMTPIANYLATNCGQAVAGGPVTYGSTPTTYGSGVVPPTGYTPPTSTAVNPQLTNVTPQPVATNMVATEAPVHEVAKKETLYGLSQRYDVSVDQIKEWNNLRGNTINVGQTLRVGPAGFAPVGTDAVVSNNSSTATNTAPPLMVNRGEVANSNLGAPQPVPYGNTPVPGVPTTTPADQQHIVQAGETVASVALRYGYTEGKFREINGLGANEYLRIGQRLKTSACDCPVNNAPVNNVSQPGIASNAGPTMYGGGVVVPQAYQPTANASAIQAGTPVGPTAVTVQSNPNNFRQPVSSPVPQTMSPPAFGSPAPTQFNNRSVVQPQPVSQTATTNQTPVTRPGSMINNDPGFGSAQPEQVGQVIPQVFRAPAGQSMNSLEGGNSNPVIGGGNTNPTTFGSSVNSNAVQNNFSNPNTRSVHVVQQGESLNTIAQRYGLTVDQLRSLNDMRRTDVIIPFQRLYIN
ncbi:hypothetical protein CEQ90_13525 [Lewinellaceae bacterium SD302]|nr:hypothetical protein CEQ90_13525 [Lewinellaceae bacterium SD302]